MPRKKGSKFRLKAGKHIEPDPGLQLQIMDEWVEDMLWCPSQCYLTVKHSTVKYQIYLRWRHDDPWSFTLIKLGPTDDVQDGEWSNEDLFEKYGHFWTEFDNLKKIEACAISCARLYLAEGFNARKSKRTKRPRLPPTV